MTWNVSSHPVLTLYDVSDTGFYARTPKPTTLSDLILVRWNKTRPRRRHVRTISVEDAGYRRLRGHYGDNTTVRTLRSLSPDDRVHPLRVLRLLAGHGPYDLCLFCSRDLTTSLSRCFGFGPYCARHHCGYERAHLALAYKVHVATELERVDVAGGIAQLEAFLDQESPMNLALNIAASAAVVLIAAVLCYFPARWSWLYAQLAWPQHRLLRPLFAALAVGFVMWFWPAYIVFRWVGIETPLARESRRLGEAVGRNDRAALAKYRIT